MRKPPSCSFCSRAALKVRQLIAGPAVFICDDCVELTTQVLDTGEHAPAITQLNAVRPDFAKVRCSFCGTKATRAPRMVEATGRRVKATISRRPKLPRICADCLGLCHQILAG